MFLLRSDLEHAARISHSFVERADACSLASSTTGDNRSVSKTSMRSSSDSDEIPMRVGCAEVSWSFGGWIEFNFAR